MMSTEIPKALHLQEKVFSIANEKEFSEIALAVYHFQFDNNPLYRQYCQSVHKTPGTVTGMADIPFLPVSFFKTHQVATTAFEPELVFRSSGTTAATTSTHYVKDAALYHKSLSLGFERYFGAPQDYCILGLLPSYLERKDASLVYMVEQLIRQSGHADSGFYLYDTDRLAATLRRLEAEGQQTLLFGVSFALLDFCRAFRH